MATWLTNHLLIATPALNGSFFHHAVVYLCEHDAEGAMGVVINQPANMTLTDLLAAMKLEQKKDSDTTEIMCGGPVQQNQGFILHDSAEQLAISRLIDNNTYLSASIELLQSIGGNQSPEHSLIVLGYAGWSAGQLEQEIAENSWLTATANHDILFNTPHRDCWHASAELLGIDINLFTDTVGHT